MDLPLKNVLKIHQERKTSGVVNLEGDFYYAQGVGQIKSEGSISGLPVNIKLISVDLK